MQHEYTRANASNSDATARRIDGVASWLLGVSLIVSSTPHIGNPYFFLGSIYGYQLVGPATGQVIAIVLPFLQMVLALCLLLRLFHSAVYLLTTVMFAIFAVIQTSAKLRGFDISCGCFGPRHEATIDWFTLLTVYGLLSLAVTPFVVQWYSVKNVRNLNVT